MFALASHAQTEKVIVKVIDSKGTPIIGANVWNIDAKGGATTDDAGLCTLKATKGDLLKVSYIGMVTRTAKVISHEIQVMLQDDTKMLDEAVITGYQKVKSRVYTGAAQLVKLDDIKLEGITDVTRMLEGRVAGLSIQNISGSFGSAPRINIRGGVSIIGNAQPLWVIDGAVYEDIVSLSLDQLASGDAETLISSAVSGINATDIEDIQVLKDAAATSIYGARALNGVIVVTTKQGKREQPIRLSYAMEMSFRRRPSYNDFDLLNSQETMSVYQEMHNKGYFDLQSTLYGRRGGVYYQMYRDLTTYDNNTGNYLLPNTETAKAAFLREHEYANTNWFKELFSQNPTISNTITLTGGGKKISTYASLGLFKDYGWTITDNVRRITANVNTTFFLSDKFSTRVIAQGNIREQRAPGTMPQQRNTTIGSFERDFDINPFAYALGTSRTLRPRDSRGQLEYYRNNWAPFNILNEYDNNYMDIGVLDLKLQAEANYHWNDYLQVKGLMAMRRATTHITHEIKEGSNVVQAFRANENPYVAAQNIYLLHNNTDPLLQPQVALPHGGIFNKTENQMKNYMGRLALDYDRTLGQHDIKAFGFAEIRHTDRITTPFQGYGIQYDKGNQVFVNPLIFQKLQGESTDYFGLTKQYNRGITFSGSATYGYAGKYVFNAVINYEGSNTAGQSNGSHWLPTWNVGAKWNINNEAFMKPYANISKLALRLSYGLTAKMNEKAINANAVYQNTIINRINFKERENALNILHLENRDLTWEKMYELNFGLDLGLYNNRISLSVDLYQRNAFDLIDLIRTSGIGGQYYKYANFGDMRTRGVELSLHTKNIQTADFGWSTSLTFSAMDQTITRLLNTPNTFDMVAGHGNGNIVGFPKGSLFSFNYQGLDNTGLPTFDYGLYPTNGSAYAKSSNADFLDTKYSKSYLIYHGPIEPQIIGGLSNTFRYKNWDLSVFMTMQAGNKIRLNPTYDPSFGDLNVFGKEYFRRWLNPGDELKTNVPVIPSKEQIALVGQENIERAYNTYNYSQMRVADGSFVRMKNISLGYKFPTGWIKGLGLRQLSMRMNITNPFLIYSDKKLNGQDPEYYKTGGVSLPTPQQYTFTLNASF
ncbi:SusC/RagA family TonB-linked outer membrane protein [Prevotella sp.]|uniref:SusC/RagA family TonB-linked outer membrane protein n=1 Tax=Prevotella sp. TaxID=59823 RepID=UPI002F91E911